MTLTIVADENIPAVEACFGHLGPVRRVNGRQLRCEQLRGADVLLVRSVTRVDRALLDGTAIDFVGTATSGVDHVDREYLARRGIGFASAPGANANSVVEYVLAAIAAVDDCLERLLRGGRVGIVGYGFIGQALAARLDALDIGYLVSDPWLEQVDIPHAAELSHILACDVVTLHPALTRRQPWPSFHLLGAAELAALGPGQLLINASRGEVVDNRALVERLAPGDGPLTVLDVWEGEPCIDAGLAAGVRLGSAHIAGYSLDGKLRGTRMLLEALSVHLGVDLASLSPGEEERSPLTITAGLGEAELIRHLLGASYDISLDDRLLRASLRERDPGAAFDRLRRHYRIRRELAGSVVISPGCTGRIQALVGGLGCLSRAGDVQP